MLVTLEQSRQNALFEVKNWRISVSDAEVLENAEDIHFARNHYIIVRVAHPRNRFHVPKSFVKAIHLTQNTFFF